MSRKRQAKEPQINNPDPASSYERAKPEKEAGMGRLDSNTDAVPTRRPDHPHEERAHPRHRGRKP